MTSFPALVKPSDVISLEQVEDNCSAIESWASETESIPDLQDASAKLAAIKEYFCRKSADGRARLESSLRRLEKRLGELRLKERNTPRVIDPDRDQDDEPSSPFSEFDDRQLADFQQMAEHPEIVEEVIKESTDIDPPSRRKIIRAITTREHPAPFSDPIIRQVASHLKEIRLPKTATIVDPFAGIGRVHRLNDDGYKDTRGVEIESEWAAKHPKTEEGNALELTKIFNAEPIDAIVTSPTYGNRMADHHDAKDDSVRLTYKHTLGHDLHDDNSGQMQWGPEYRDFHKKAWIEAVNALKSNGTLTLNIKNHIRIGREQRVVEWHLMTLIDLGMRLDVMNHVCQSKGLMAGENSDVRVAGEFVLTFRKPE